MRIGNLLGIFLIEINLGVLAGKDRILARQISFVDEIVPREEQVAVSVPQLVHRAVLRARDDRRDMPAVNNLVFLQLHRVDYLALVGLVREVELKVLDKAAHAPRFVDDHRGAVLITDNAYARPGIFVQQCEEAFQPFVAAADDRVGVVVIFCHSL